MTGPACDFVRAGASSSAQGRLSKRRASSLVAGRQRRILRGRRCSERRLWAPEYVDQRTSPAGWQVQGTSVPAYGILGGRPTTADRSSWEPPRSMASMASSIWSRGVRISPSGAVARRQIFDRVSSNGYVAGSPRRRYPSPAGNGNISRCTRETVQTRRLRGLHARETGSSVHTNRFTGRGRLQVGCWR